MVSIPSGTRDTRRFRHYAKFAADGTVAGIVAFAHGVLPNDGEQSLYVDVTELHPHDLRDVKLTKQQLAERDPAAILAVCRQKDKGRPDKTVLRER